MAANRNVKVVRNNGKEAIVKAYKKTSSTAFDGFSLVEFASGLLSPSDDNDTTVLGVIQEEVKSSDSDYASETTKLVELIQPGDEVEMTTSAQATVGVSYGISNAYTVDVSDTTNDVFTVTEVLSSTRARGFLRSVAGGLQ